MRYFRSLMKRIVTFVALLGASAATICAQNAAPVVTKALPAVTLYGGAPKLPVDLTTAFQDPDLTPAVRLQTVLGQIDVALYERQKPITVANFLRYVDEGRYFLTDPTTNQLASSFIHRSVPSFVIQGGGFIGTVDPNSPDSVRVTQVAAFPPIQNEPGISNKRGTLAMAKTAVDPNSATSQWFVNLADNGGGSAALDTQNGGFTVFATVMAQGMDVADRIANLPTYNFGSPFDQLPLISWVSPNPVKVENLVSLPSITRVGPVHTPLSFTAATNNPAVAEAKVSGRTLLVSGKAVGTAQITVTAKDIDGATVSQTFTANVIGAPGRLVNLSTRARVRTGDDAMIGGFIMRGNAPKRLIIRAIGPTLADSGITDFLVDPKIELYNGAGALIASSDDWPDFKKQAIIDTGIPPKSSKEAAILTTLPSSTDGGAYTAVVRGVGDTTGVGLVEVYDLDAGPGSTLLNISTRARLGTADNDSLIGGFVLGGDSKRILIRALGPSLNLPEKLSDPKLELRNNNGELVEANNDWQMSAQASEIQATGIAPSQPQEAAVLKTLAPGPYTAIVRSNNGTTGVGLVEIYQLQ